MTNAGLPSASSYADFLIIGAGISGINFAYRIQTSLPSLSYSILEARDNIGGTWDLFKYPGIRSDSDLYTFGFPWRPWMEQRAIADGESIVRYMQETARVVGIDRHISFRHKVVSASWEDEKREWSLEVQNEGRIKNIRARFLILGTGYYDYNNPLSTHIPGLENFKGTVEHPQFWPKDLDFSKKKVVIIGSGATAITLLPSLAKEAANVTMLQRSPGYIISLSNRNFPFIGRIFPQKLVHLFLRVWFIVIPFLFFHFCRSFPSAAKWVLRFTTENQLPKHIPYNPHFKPNYNPWEQRLCVSPDSDFFKALHSGKASISTGHIKTFTEKSIILETGETIDDVDIVITATGLQLLFGGGAEIKVNGQIINASEKFVWKSCMLQDVPNACFVMGYSNASWTLGADATAMLFCRLVKKMDKLCVTHAIPSLDPGMCMKEMPVLDLNSTYVRKAFDRIPKAGDRGPWKARSNYFLDYCKARWGNLTEGLEFSRPDSRPQVEKQKAT